MFFLISTNSPLNTNIMKQVILLGLIVGLIVFLAACSKKDKGICYCKYVNGNKTQFDLTSLDKAKQKDSCAVLSSNASFFGGSCSVK